MMVAAQILTNTVDEIAAWVESEIAPDLEYLVPPEDGAVEGVEIARAHPSVFKMFVPASERLPEGAQQAPSIAVRLLNGFDRLDVSGREITVQLVLTIWAPGTFENEQFIRDMEGWRDLFNGLGVIVAAVEGAGTIAGSTVDKKTGVTFGFYEVDKEIPDLYPYWMGTVEFKLLRAPHASKRFNDML